MEFFTEEKIKFIEGNFNASSEPSSLMVLDAKKSRNFRLCCRDEETEQELTCSKCNISCHRKCIPDALRPPMNINRFTCSACKSKSQKYEPHMRACIICRHFNTKSPLVPVVLDTAYKNPIPQATIKGFCHLFCLNEFGLQKLKKKTSNTLLFTNYTKNGDGRIEFNPDKQIFGVEPYFGYDKCGFCSHDLYFSGENKEQSNNLCWSFKKLCKNHKKPASSKFYTYHPICAKLFNTDLCLECYKNTKEFKRYLEKPKTNQPKEVIEIEDGNEEEEKNEDQMEEEKDENQVEEEKDENQVEEEKDENQVEEEKDENQVEEEKDENQDQNEEENNEDQDEDQNQNKEENNENQDQNEEENQDQNEKENEKENDENQDQNQNEEENEDQMEDEDNEFQSTQELMDANDEKKISKKRKNFNVETRNDHFLISIPISNNSNNNDQFSESFSKKQKKNHKEVQKEFELQSKELQSLKSTLNSLVATVMEVEQNNNIALNKKTSEIISTLNENQKKITSTQFDQFTQIKNNGELMITEIEKAIEGSKKEVDNTLQDFNQKTETNFSNLNNQVEQIKKSICDAHDSTHESFIQQTNNRFQQLQLITQRLEGLKKESEKEYSALSKNQSQILENQKNLMESQINLSKQLNDSISNMNKIVEENKKETSSLAKILASIDSKVNTNQACLAKFMAFIGSINNQQIQPQNNYQVQFQNNYQDQNQNNYQDQNQNNYQDQNQNNYQDQSQNNYQDQNQNNYQDQNQNNYQDQSQNIQTTAIPFEELNQVPMTPINKNIIDGSSNVTELLFGF